MIRRLVSRAFWPVAARVCQSIGVASRAAWLWLNWPEKEDR